MVSMILFYEWIILSTFMELVSTIFEENDRADCLYIIYKKQLIVYNILTEIESRESRG